MPNKYDVVSISDLKRIVGLIELRALFAIRDYYDTSKGNDGVATMANKLKAIVDAHSVTTTISTVGSIAVDLSITINYPALPFTVTTDSAGRPTVEYINGQADTASSGTASSGTDLSDGSFDFNNITIIVDGAYVDGSNIISYEQKVLSANDTIAQFIVNRILKTSYANLTDYIHKHDVIDFYHDYTDVLSNADTIVVNGSACRACVASCTGSCGNGCTSSCAGSCVSSCAGRSVCGNCDGRCQDCSGLGICTPCTGTCGNSCSARCNGCSNSCGGGCSSCTGSCTNLCSSGCAVSCTNSSTGSSSSSSSSSSINLHSEAAVQ